MLVLAHSASIGSAECALASLVASTAEKTQSRLADPSTVERVPMIAMLPSNDYSGTTSAALFTLFFIVSLV